MGHWQISGLRCGAFAGAAAALLLLALLGAVATRRAGQAGFLARLVCGADGRASTSKSQAFVWSAIALFGIVEVFLERLLLGLSDLDTSIPVNLLVAMGFTVTTLTAAKGITVSYVDSGLVDKGSGARDAKGGKLGGLFSDDDGAPDLSKIQMLAFTLVAVAMYLVRMALQESSPPEVADIDPALMVMMGLSQGAYLGKKLTTTSVPRVAGMTPSIAAPGAPLVLTGVNFGDETAGILVTIAGEPASIVSHDDKTITCRVPLTRGGAVRWTTQERARVTVIANGREAVAPFELVVEGP